MNGMVKNVFLMLLGTVVAIILYLIFFGWGTGTTDGLFRTDGNMSSNINGGTYVASDTWRGLIYYAGEAVETSISSYYYTYGFMPVAHRTDDVDNLIGMVNSGSDVATFKSNCLLKPAAAEYLNSAYSATHGGSGAHGIISPMTGGTWYKTPTGSSDIKFSVVAK